MDEDYGGFQTDGIFRNHICNLAIRMVRPGTIGQPQGFAKDIVDDGTANEQTGGHDLLHVMIVADTCDHYIGWLRTVE